jgi:hypothetical protein
MDAGLLVLLNQHVTIAPATGLDSEGMTTYGTAVTYDALVVGKQKLMRDMQGREVVSSAQVYVDGTAVVTASSKITLPDGTTPTILAVSSYPDLDGVTDHQVIYT